MPAETKGDQLNSEQDYNNVRRVFHDSVEQVVLRSVSLNGTPSVHGRQYWGSILLAKLAVTGMTVDQLAPTLIGKRSKFAWDLSSIATLVRTIAENYLMFYWLCVETENDDLWHFRFALLSVVDNRSRLKLTADMEGSSEPEDFLNAQLRLAMKLRSMPLFQALPEKRQRELLKGDRLPFIQDDVMNALPLDRTTFRKLYRYLSAFVHTGTISFFRNEQNKRGDGERNWYDMVAIGGALELATVVLDRALVDTYMIDMSIKGTGRELQP